MFSQNKKTTVIMIALLCVSITMMSTTATADSYCLSPAMEDMAVGGSNCNDFLNGFAVGMGIGALFGCPWCAGVAIASKTLEMFAC